MFLINHLQEAKASSEIENIITTNDELYKSIVADKKFDNSTAKEVPIPTCAEAE